MSPKKFQKYFKGSSDRIIELQNNDGSIPWFKNGVFDAWNHLESLMALNTLGFRKEVEFGFTFLKNNQRKDGSWFGELGSTLEIDEETGKFLSKKEELRIQFKDTNFASYIATACWHDYLLSKSANNLKDKWQMLDSAIGFVINNQLDNGTIRWAAESPEAPKEDSLLTGCCSIYKSLICAINSSKILGIERPEWKISLNKLKDAITNKPESFDKTWESKKRFSMDWYYPVLCGVISGEEAKNRITEHWNTFVVEELGCLCVSDQPWVTIAETAELSISLVKINEIDKASDLLRWLENYRDKNGAYWMGKQYSENAFWPAEKPGWTSAAVILAADSIYKFSSGSEIFLKDDLI